MISLKVSTSGFELTKQVPSSIEEYNALAPKRENAVLEDAIANTLYRGTFAKFRTAITEAIAKDMGVEWPNSGTKEKPVYMSEGKFFNQLLASSGLSEEDFIAKYQSLAQSTMDAAPFDPSIREGGSSDGPKIGKNDLANAEALLKLGGDKVREVAGKLAAKLNREVNIVGDDEADKKTIALAFGDWRRKQAAELAAQQKAELGL